MTKPGAAHFPVDGRTAGEVARLKAAGYVEYAQFKRGTEPRVDGYFCGSCAAYIHEPGVMPRNPSAVDGYCTGLDARDRAHGCCNLWHLRQIGRTA